MLEGYQKQINHTLSSSKHLNWTIEAEVNFQITRKLCSPIFGPTSDPHISIKHTQLHTVQVKSLKWVDKNKVKLQSWTATKTGHYHQRKKIDFHFTSHCTNQPNKHTQTQKARIKIEDTHHRNRNELSNTWRSKTTCNSDWKSKRVLEWKTWNWGESGGCGMWERKKWVR